MTLTAKQTPYSSIVVSSVTLHEPDGRADPSRILALPSEEQGMTGITNPKGVSDA